MTAPTVIIGASAAGLLTASLLAEQGYAVTVFERSEALGPAARTLIVTAKMLDLLDETGERAVLNRIERFELFADGRSAVIPLRHPDLIIERSVLINTLAERALAAGAELRLGHRFIEMEPASGGMRIQFDNQGHRETVVSPTVVGADGTYSSVATSAGWPRQSTCSLVQAIIPLPPDAMQGTSRVWFRPQDTPYFYWLIPESSDRAALGVIGGDGVLIRKRLDAFLAEKGFESIGYQAAVIPAYTRWIPVHRRVGEADVYLVGDAAGQVKVSTVGGIVTGFKGALGVTRAIAEGRPSRAMRPLKRELNLHLLIRRALHNFSEDDYRYLLDRMSGPVGRSLGRHHRDDATKVIRSVALRNPMLVLRLVRSLVANTSFGRA
jgi:flavin-dependent dehydrogenase